MEHREGQLITALDFPTWEDARTLVDALEEVQWFKIGLEMFLASRGQAIDQLKSRGKKVFLDLKFHDIPNTVAQACRQAVGWRADMLNVHALGGRVMMEKAAEAVREEAASRGMEAPLLIGVTVLTSMDGGDLGEVGLSDPEADAARLATLAQSAGLGGVVASPWEIARLRRACGPDFKIVCPGIRPGGSALGDQKRVKTPAEAVREGADFLVVGRPVTQAPDPAGAARAILKEIREAG
jgi:orotidine-5'-phosphate decarboxylase